MILVTGACGRLGGDIARRLHRRGMPVRATDLAPCASMPSDLAFCPGDLANFATALRLAEGCTAILHFAGMAVEAEYGVLEPANLHAAYNVFEAARRSGCRVVYASSHHVVGFHEADRELTPDAAFRPDTLYAATKAFGELLSSLYWDKHGVESACLRIGSWEREPLEPRHLRTWLSHDDLERLVLGCLEMQTLGRRVIWGVSNNTGRRWRDGETAGFEVLVKDDALDWAEHLGSSSQAYPFHGGRFCDEPAPGAENE